jgi:hypothetical protein
MPTPRPPATQPATPFLSDDELAVVMHGELKQLLDTVPAARRVLKHLALLERLLATDGLDGIGSLPQPTLEKTITQLGSLPLPADTKSLPELLSLLRLALEARVRRSQRTDAAPYLSSFLTEDKLVVSEASHTDFMRVMGGDAPKDGSS